MAIAPMHLDDEDGDADAQDGDERAAVGARGGPMVMGVRAWLSGRGGASRHMDGMWSGAR